MDRADILGWLRESDPERLEELWRLADRVRRESVGEEIHLRGLVEISNHCIRRCAYCGIRVQNRLIERYRMTEEEILECVQRAVELGFGTVVLQAGEDPEITAGAVAGLIRRIQAETRLAITLSLGERSPEDLEIWRRAGADRYLIRFETSNADLFARLHPPLPGRASDRVAILRTLRALDYEVGSGVLIGLPGQSYEDLAQDIGLFGRLDLDMIGVGPFIPHPETPLGSKDAGWLADGLQAPNTEEMTYKVVALARLVCPSANIPATTALATLNRESGRELGLERGANIVMPNLTPPRYRVLYEIYPGKACLNETAEVCRTCLAERIERMGRRVGTGRGNARSWSARRRGALTIPSSAGWMGIEERP